MFKLKDNFASALKYEKEMQPFADEWYKNTLNAVGIERYDWNDSMGKKMQSSGIDCTVLLNDYTGNKNWVNISEKFRKEEWGDMFIELYSMLPEVEGWAFNTGNVDMFAYFTPKYVRLINPKELTNFAKYMLNKLTRSELDELQMLENDRVYKTFSTPQNRSVTVQYIKTRTSIESGKVWYGVGVCVPWDVLKDMGVGFVEHKLK